MARGANAKIEVENKITAAFGADYVGNVDKKIYVWADDGGERVQIAISLTCPKVPVSIGNMGGDGLDFDNLSMNTEAPEPFKPAEITIEETENIRKMLSELGL